MPLLVGLARLLPSLSEQKKAAVLFMEQVLQPNASGLLEISREDPDTYELTALLLRSVGGSAWAGFLAHLALEGLQRLPSDPSGTERVQALIEAVAATGEGRAAFPPFFDFALEELLGRLPDLPPDGRMLQQAVRILARVHFERPDFLGLAVPTLVSAASRMEGAEASDLALRLSSFAALYARVAVEIDVLASRAPSTVDSLQAALVSICSFYEHCGVALQDLLAGQHEGRDHGHESLPSGDAICLALSAFTQVASRHPSSSYSSNASITAARKELAARGSELLEASATAWQKYGLQLSAPQTHIFVAAFRTLCIGPGLAPPKSATLAALETQRRALLERAAVGDRDARLCLAVFEELGRDASCPEALRASFNVSTSDDAAGPPHSASNRLRQHMQAATATSGAAWAKGPARAAPSDGKGPSRNFLQRLFGL